MRSICILVMAALSAQDGHGAAAVRFARHPASRVEPRLSAAFRHERFAAPAKFRTVIAMRLPAA